MKRILFTILLLLATGLTSYAGEENLTFLYINGSNNNDKKMKDWYINGVHKLHPVIKKKFEKNSTIKKWSKDNKLVIDKDPNIFFWGYDSKTDLDFVKDRLNISKAFSSTVAYEVRSILTQFLHDAIWVQKTHNMLPILDDLNDQVKLEYQNNHKVILFGYSAGTFVTYQYMLYKLPYIKLDRFFSSLKADDDFIQFVKDNPRKPTCLSALSYKKGNIGVIASTGDFIINQNKDKLKQNYLNIDNMTDLYCAPEDAVQGVVNFASPIPLFYSDLTDKNYDITYFNRYLMKYIFENGIYFLTVNFREDPLGFPIGRNLTIEQYENFLKLNIENPTGVVYDDSSVWSKRPAIFAHTSYWSGRRTFANAIVKSFINGTRFQYDKAYQKRILKHNRKRSEVLSDREIIK